MDVVAAAPSADLAAGDLAHPSLHVDLMARRAALLRRRRAGAFREWLGVVAVGGVAVWMAAMALVTMVAR